MVHFMNNHSNRAALGLLFLLLSTSTLLQAQEDKSPAIGIHPARSYDLSSFETIDTATGNMSLQIPVMSLPPGRGGAPGPKVDLIYNSSLWEPYLERRTAVGPPPQGSTVYFPEFLRLSDEGGWRLGFQYGVKVYDRRLEHPEEMEDQQYWDLEYQFRWKVKMVFPDGGQHEFQPVGSDVHGLYDVGDRNGYTRVRPDGWKEFPSGERWTTGKATYYSIDGTYLRLEFDPDGDQDVRNNPWTLYLPDGTKVTGRESSTEWIYYRTHSASYPNSVQIRSTYYNGNPATELRDSLDRTLIVEYAGNTWNLRMTGANGTQVVTSLVWTSVFVNRQYSAYLGYPAPVDGYLGYVLDVIDHIDFPAQLTTGGVTPVPATFDYAADDQNNYPPTYSEGWGQLKSFATVTGVQMAYVFVLNQMAPSVKPPSADVLNNQRIATKTRAYTQLYDGLQEPLSETWTYSNCGAIVFCSPTTVTNPDGGVVREYRFGTGDWREKLASKTEYPAGRIVERIWDRTLPFNLASAGTRTINPYVKTEFTTVQDSSGVRRTAIKNFSRNANGNVTAAAEYDWVPYGDVPRDGGGQPTGLPPGTQSKLRETVTAFYNDPGVSSTYTYDQPTAPKLLRLAKSVEVRSGSTATAIGRTEFQYDDVLNTGNLTVEKTWNSNKGGQYRPLGGAPNYLTSTNSETMSHQYDGYGNRTWTTDARLYQTKYDYEAINGYTALYVTRVTTAYGTSVARKQEYEYDFNTGLVTLDRDADNQVWTTTHYDALGRADLIRAAYGTPAESYTRNEYLVGVGGTRVIARSDLNSANDQQLVSVEHYDPMGRIRLHRTLETTSQQATSETHGIKVQTRYKYSGSNSYTLVSNPYRASYSYQAGSGLDGGSMGWTLTRYDQAGRVVSIKTFGGYLPPSPWQYGGQSNTQSTGEVTAVYEREFVTTTDQATKKSRSRLDGIGRLVRADEPDAAGSLGPLDAPVQATFYTYDALDALRVVQQGQQTRYFCYDSRNLLLRAFNVEQQVNSSLTWTDTLTGRSSWSTAYQYDGNGNLIQRVDARGITTTYGYDPQNRLQTRSYSDSTPSTTYEYGITQGVGQAPLLQRGQLLRVNTAGVSLWENLVFDQAGRVTQTAQTTGTIAGTMSYTYDRAGNLKTQTYPSGRVLTYSFDRAGRTTSVVGGTTTYSQLYTYQPHGAVRSMRVGLLYEQRRYNSRLQARQMGLGQTLSSSTNLTTTYCNRLLLGYEFGATASNNGNVSQQTIAIPGKSYTQTYGYDSLNRLNSVGETGSSTWNQGFIYDRYGNLAKTGDGVFYSSVSYDLNTNRLISFVIPGYGTLSVDQDPAGNIRQGTTYTHDAEDRITYYSGSTYGYDGDGRRVRRVAGGVTTLYFYDVQGRLAAEYSSAPANPVRTLYITADHLGSTRLVTRQDGTVESRYDFRPFGADLPATGTGARRSTADLYGYDSVKQRFTGKERDPESALDFFGARYYWNAAGRFTSVDPENAGAEVPDPQSWNGYAYARNNPVIYTDPTGLRYLICDQNGQNCAAVRDDEWEPYLAKSDLIVANNRVYAKKADGTVGEQVGIAVWTGPDLDRSAMETFAAVERMAGPPVKGLAVATLAVTGVMWGAAAVSLSGPPIAIEIGSLPFADPSLRDRVLRVLQNISQGIKSFKRDGITFINKEGRLPIKPQGYYKEWTVANPGATHRGVERIVTGAGGEIYYSPNHYGSFVRIR